MATPQTPRARRSPLARYAPALAVVVVIAIVAVVIGLAGGGSKKKAAVITTPNAKSTFSDVPIIYSEAKAAGTLSKYTWQPHCDTTTGAVAIPVLYPPPCVPVATPTAGASAPGVTPSTIKIGYYIAKPDPVTDALLKQAGAYDDPNLTAKAYQNYFQIYQNLYELYGRKVQLVRIDGTGTSTDNVAAKADADKAAADGVFAMLGGPTQAQNFDAELAHKHIMCIGTCVVSSPEATLAQYAPYLMGGGPTPEQTALMTTELVKKQLVGKKAVYAGDPTLQSKTRSFALLSYNTVDGQFTDAWNGFYNDLKNAGAPVAGHIFYNLNLNGQLAGDARTIATRLKATGATTIVFTGDPLFPIYLTKAMTAQNYFPEWVMAGTVLADTDVFARLFDQRQWAHAFGLQLIPARLEKTQQDSYTLHEWWFGTKPPTDNNYQIVKGDVELMMDGLQLAGPNLTPTTFRDGLWHAPPQKSGPGEIGAISTYGNHGYWSTTDYGGLDNAGILFWDPTTVGPDETGHVAAGMYRLVDGGRRYLPGQWPTQPVPLFKNANTVTVYSANNVPAELKPKPEPVPAGAPSQAK